MPNHATKPSPARKIGEAGYMLFLWHLACDRFMRELKGDARPLPFDTWESLSLRVAGAFGRGLAKITIPAILALALYHAWVM